MTKPPTASIASSEPSSPRSAPLVFSAPELAAASDEVARYVTRAIETLADAVASAVAARAAVPSQAPDPIEVALAEASRVGRWDVVAQLARELEARRLAAAGNVVALDPSRRRDRG